MQVTKTNFFTILNAYYTIHKYQRLYSWTMANCTKLLENFYEEFENKENNTYFLGSLIIKGNLHKVNTFEIIDGQQRLTTICILLKAIADLLKEKNPFLYDTCNKLLKKQISQSIFQNIIIHNDVDAVYFTAIINSTYLEIEQKNNALGQKSNIYNNYIFFYNTLCGKELINKKGKLSIWQEHKDEDAKKEYFLNDEKLEELYAFIYNKCELVQITLDANEKENEIFNTMNSTGLRLTTGDLLKNTFFASNIEDSTFYNQWKEIFEADQIKIYFWSQHMDFILYTILIINETDSPTFSSFAQQSKYSNLHKRYEQLIKDNNNIKDQFLSNILKVANFYYDSINNNNYNQLDPKNDQNLVIFAIQQTGYSALYSIIIFMEQYSASSNEDKNLLYKHLLKMMFAWKLFSFGSNKLSKIISNILHYLQTKNILETINYINKLINDNLTKVGLSTSESVIKELQDIKVNSSNKSNKNTIIMLLSFIEMYKRQKNTEQYFEYNSSLQSIEHVIPQNHKKYYNITNENIIVVIGNYTFLNKPSNSKASNKDEDYKKIIYGSSSLLITKNLTEQPINEQSIEERNNNFVKIIYDNIFNI